MQVSATITKGIARITAAAVRSLVVVSGMLLAGHVGLDAIAQDTDQRGPDIGVWPEAGSYLIAASTRELLDAGSAQPVDVSIKLTDPDGLSKSNLSVTLVYGSTSETITNVTWAANSDSTFASAKCRVQLIDPGDYVLSVVMTDNTGVQATARATYKVTYTDPTAPIVNVEPHHDDYRNTTIGAMAYNYATPAYTSFGASRSIGLRYDSEQADPTAFVQLDVNLATSLRASFDGGRYTLRIVNPVSNQPVTAEQQFAINPGGRQRIAAQWRMPDHPSGAYTYWADVRAYRSDGTASPLKRVSVRVLVVNHSASRLGSGWSFAGVQRIHLPPSGIIPSNMISDGGLLLEEGNGVARWFAKEACGYLQCTYRTPKGDFSQIVYVKATDQWVRTYPGGAVATFTGRGLLKSVADGFGRTTHFSWHNGADPSKEPLLSQVTDPVWKAISFAYHWGTHLGVITDPTGRKTEFWYEGATSAGPPAGKAADLSWIGNGTLPVWFAYDANHRLTSSRDSTGTTAAAYDEFGKLARLTAPEVSVAVPGGTTVRVRPVTQFISLQAVTVPAANVLTPHPPVPWDAVLTSVTDPGGHRVKVMTDRYGSPTRVLDHDGAMILGASYSQHGLPISATTQRQTVTQSWNDRGQLVSNEVNDRPVFHASHDHRGETYYDNSGGEKRWYKYGDKGELLKSWYGEEADEARNGTTYTYDTQFRLVSVAGPKGERAEWSFESQWQNLQEVRWLDDEGTWQKASFAYDEAGRQKSVTDALGQIVSTTYDNVNRRLTITQGDRITSFGYTGVHQTSVTVPSGKVYGFSYNALGWLERETFPDTRTRSYTYNVDGLLASRTDRRGKTVTLAYDARHRLVSRGADGTQATFVYPFGTAQYVTMTNNEVVESIGHHSESGGLATTTYAFNGGTSYVFSRILDGNAGWSQTGLTVNRYTFGSLVRTDSVQYTHDYTPADPARSHVYQIINIDEKVSALAYDASGRLVRTALGNGVVQENVFNREGQRTSTTVNAVPSLSASYAYDELGRLTTRTSAAGDYRWYYQYDPHGQVTLYQKAQLEPTPGCNPSFQNCEYLWVPKVQEQYFYDLAGNRTGAGVTLEANSNRYRTFGGFTFDYDAEGNITRKYKAGFDQRLTWNDLGQLASVTTGGITVTYGYAPSGARLRRTEGGQSRYYLYEGLDLLLELDHSKNPVRHYTHLPGIDNPLSVKETVAGTERMYYFMTQYPGHVAAVLNANGGLVAGYDYAPFGAATGTNDGQPLRFMARELDFSTGLYYVRNRWYDAAQARFISEDPIGLEGGLNTYAYVDNDPVNATDPTGLCPDVTLTPDEYYALLDHLERMSGGDPDALIAAMKCKVTMDYETDTRSLDGEQLLSRRRRFERVVTTYSRAYANWYRTNTYGTYLSRTGDTSTGPAAQLIGCMADADNDMVNRSRDLGNNLLGNSINIGLAVWENAACLPSGLVKWIRGIPPPSNPGSR